MSFKDKILSATQFIIGQRKELAELFGFETRNKYEIKSQSGEVMAYAAEQQKGVLGFLLRYFLGHWRSFEIHVFDELRNIALVAKHPFAFWFQHLDLYDAQGIYLGKIQQRFSLLSKKFDVLGAKGELLFSVNSGLFSIWNFSFIKEGQEIASIQKKWGGLLKEMFLDADQFMLEIRSGSLTYEERCLLLVSTLFVDLQYFENKAD